MREECGGTVLVGEGEFVCENVEAAVDLHRISVDDFKREVGGQINGQLRLTRTGGAGYNHHLWSSFSVTRV